MNETQQAAIQGAINGAVTAAKIAVPVAVGVATVADPRVGVALQAMSLSLNLLNTAAQLQQMGQLSDSELMQLWAARGAAMAKAHDEIFGADAAVNSDPNVQANTAAARPVVATATPAQIAPAQIAPAGTPMP